MSFIKEDGKGFVGAHTGDDAFFDWPEFGEMIGGYFDNHPWGAFDAPIIVEDTAFPAMKHFPARFTIKDEIYQHKRFLPRQSPRAGAAWTPRSSITPSRTFTATTRISRSPGPRCTAKGRVFYSTFGHAAETWDDPQVQKMYSRSHPVGAAADRRRCEVTRAWWGRSPDLRGTSTSRCSHSRISPYHGAAGRQGRRLSPVISGSGRSSGSCPVPASRSRSWHRRYPRHKLPAWCPAPA